MIRALGYIDPWTVQVQLYKNRKLVDGFLDLTNELENPDWSSVKRAVSKSLLFLTPPGDPKLSVIGVGIHKLEPKGVQPWSVDTALIEKTLMFHIAIVTNPFCVVFSGPANGHLPTGQITFVATDVFHSAVNNGDSPVYHLCLECRNPVKPPVETVQ